ncbi:MAG: hypothetical protein CML55_06375 [Rhodobacteraceae bacterium]|nr:hypothetical protein [Paracoccaceae bacterium]MBO28976.1 hypothetical protein [Paracoccaceae bacterium]
MIPLTLLPRRTARTLDTGQGADPGELFPQQADELRGRALASLTPVSRGTDDFVWFTRRKTGAARGDLPPP